MATFGHKDADGRALPCSYAEHEELLALCQAMMAAGRGVLEVTPNLISLEDALAMMDMMGELSLETGVAASVDGIFYVPQRGDFHSQMVAKLEKWQKLGARLTAQVIARPFDQTFNLAKSALLFAKTPAWSKVALGPVEGRIAALTNPATRPVQHLFAVQPAAKTASRDGQTTSHRACSQAGIEHRLARPRHPQTNGIVERFNGRISGLLQQTEFHCRAELQTTLPNYLKLFPETIDSLLLRFLQTTWAIERPPPMSG